MSLLINSKSCDLEFTHICIIPSCLPYNVTRSLAWQFHHIPGRSCIQRHRVCATGSGICKAILEFCLPAWYLQRTSSLSIILLRSICIILGISSSFFLKLVNSIPLFEYTSFCLLIHHSTEIWIFSTFGYLNNRTIKIHLQVLFSFII